MPLPPSLDPRFLETPNQAGLEIEKLMGLHPKGFDLGLERVINLLHKLGNPHKKLPPVIHIAGTNGKGSCTAFCRAFLESSGYKTHVHTSPHLVHWHERYRLANEVSGSSFVDDDVLTQAIRRVADANAGAAITVFEILTVVMFVLFSEHPADVAIIEVGLGGRGDATNVIENPAATVIMPVSYDHQAFLGDTIEAIASEKAGIIKNKVPLVIGMQPFQKATDVIQDIAASRNAPYSVYGQDYLAFQEHERMVYQHPNGLTDLPMPALLGRHQLANAASALMAVKAAGFDIKDDALDAAMQNVSWPGRMQKLSTGPLIELAPKGSEIWVDGGHNRDAALTIAEFLASCEDKVERPLFIISGMINTKQPSDWFDAFAGMARHAFTVPIHSSEAGIDPVILADKANEVGISAEPVESVADALSILGNRWNGLERAPRILIGGSLYLAGDVLRDNGTPPQ